jgi:HEPN domain-containing protein
LREGFHAQTCFQAHQVAEKALKALHYAVYNKRFVPGVSLAQLSEGQNFDEDLREQLFILDQYYIPTRYPNGLPEAAPFEVYTKRQAEEAVSTARTVLLTVKERLDEQHET